MSHWLTDGLTDWTTTTTTTTTIFTWNCASRHSCVQFFDIGTSKKWSDPDVFCTSSLDSVLLATAACNFWFLLWPHDSAPAALTSLLFDSPETQIIGKNTAFRDVSNICGGWIFFLLTFALLHLLSLDFTSSHLLFISFINSPYCRKFTI